METALLTNSKWYATDALVASGGASLCAARVPGLSASEQPNPYHLPTVDSGDVVIVQSGWIRHLHQSEVDVVARVLMPLRERFNVIAGLDQADPFQLDFSDQVMDLMDVVLKVNGVYTDRDLYNYVVGAPTPDGRWTEKAVRGSSSYSLSNLNKVRPALPCFVGLSSEFRALTRSLYVSSSTLRGCLRTGDRLWARLPRRATSTRPHGCTVHFFGSMTHVQRAEAVRKLSRSALRLKGGITSVSPFVAGFDGAGIKSLTDDERRELWAGLLAEGLTTGPLNRLRYQMSMADCKAVLSITGHGELCFRMAEAWANRRVLVCQDLSHVRTMFPFENGGNVVYCKPDLSDLLEVLDDIECNFSNYVHVAERGYHDWTQWSARAEELIQQAFFDIREAQASTSFANDGTFDKARQLCR